MKPTIAGIVAYVVLSCSKLFVRVLSQETVRFVKVHTSEIFFLGGHSWNEKKKKDDQVCRFPQVIN